MLEKFLGSKKIEKYTWIQEKLSMKRFLGGWNGFDPQNILLVRHL